MAIDTLFLDDPLLEEQLKAPDFFNGRLLTQEDLTQERMAQRARRTHLGRAIGSGIAFGLEVAPDLAASSPGDVVLDIASGLAIAPDGDSLHLAEPVRLHFSIRPDSLAEAAATDSSEFGDCEPGTTVVSVAESGLHMLVIGPARGTQGLAPVSGLGNEAAPCNTKYLTAGVRFRALPVDVGVDPGIAPALYRSAVARECFGFFNSALSDLVADPFAVRAPLEQAIVPAVGAEPAPGYSKVDLLRAHGEIAACEVPLALVHLNDDGTLDFVDIWPVRRSLVRPAHARRWWPFGGSDARRRAEAEAAMLCFQDHITAMLGGSGLSGVTAASRFAFLPGGGFLPVGPERFSPAAFLGPTATAVYDEGFGRLRLLVEESWHCDAYAPGPGSAPPLSYFVFPQAAGRWVFFLRRRTEVTYLDLDGDEGDDVGNPPAGVEEQGQLLVIIMKKKAGLGGEPEVNLLNRKGVEVQIIKIQAEEARELLNRAGIDDTRVQPARGGSAGGVTTALNTTFPEAHFFASEPLEPGKYLLSVSRPGIARDFSEFVSISAGSVLPVLVD